jgi:hypothetical protein
MTERTETQTITETQDTILARFKVLLQKDQTSKTWEFLTVVFLSILVSFLVGWMVFGWWIAPVEWEHPEYVQQPVDMNGLELRSKMTYVYLLQEWNAYSGDKEKFLFFASQMSDVDFVACYMATQSVDFAERARLIRVAYLVNGYGCME